MYIYIYKKKELYEIYIDSFVNNITVKIHIKFYAFICKFIIRYTQNYMH